MGDFHYIRQKGLSVCGFQNYRLGWLDEFLEEKPATIMTKLSRQRLKIRAMLRLLVIVDMEMMGDSYHHFLESTMRAYL